MKKVKTQYGNLTEAQWRTAVIEKLIDIQKLLIRIADVSTWSDNFKEHAMQMEMERYKYELDKKKEKEGEK